MVVILGPKDIAARLGISERGAQRLMRQGDIPGFRAGVKLWRTTELHLEGYIQRRLLEQRGLAAGRETHSGLPTNTVPVLAPAFRQRRPA